MCTSTSWPSSRSWLGLTSTPTPVTPPSVRFDELCAAVVTLVESPEGPTVSCWDWSSESADRQRAGDEQHHRHGQDHEAASATATAAGDLPQGPRRRHRAGLDGVEERSRDSRSIMA
jgi:hypothetical protein